MALPEDEAQEKEADEARLAARLSHPNIVKVFTCGTIEGIITLYMMAEGFVPPTLNLVEVDGRCAMIRHVQHIEKKEIQIAAVQNFAFGGVNTTLFIKRFD